ncbi:hypothetical protein IMY05_009G0067100 [Salix suchowensis]|nr:hypothetical protein IMY05_009G0067100 [Salix suchowensis]
MGGSGKELLHLAHKSSSTNSSNAVLHLKFLPMCTSHHQTEKPQLTEPSLYSISCFTCE